ncbi:50S ribosomal protein L21 [PVC group bacterium (ex Bugula neritina AB1)]|nr:50S ribosomal protein L21 [PVC group bacterium (ex Bugula neritina AB1)]
MYAIVDHSGKQHKVVEGEVIRIDKLDKEQGDTIEFDKVLYLSKGEVPQVGSPYIGNAKVFGEVLGDIRDKKVIAFTYRRRKSSSRKVGHRQTYSCVKIKEIKISKED